MSPVLQLTNASPINTSSVAGSIDFYNNTGGTGTSTVYYNGTSQQVYANSTSSLDNSPQTYQYLQLTGSGTKTIDAGTLTVGSDLTSSATTVLFSTNNTTAIIGGNWTNSSGLTQGSGNFTVSGSLTNNSGGTLNLGSGNLSIATNYTNNVGGIYTQSTGTTYFNGSGAQALVDNSTTGTLFKAVGFNGGGTSTMSAGTNNINFAVAPTGILTMSNSSKLVAGSSSAAYLTLKSDTTGTATVANIPSGCSITGFVTVERFVQGNKTFDALTNRWVGRNYRLLSSPVNEGVDLSGNYPCSLNYLGAKTIITNCTSTYATTGGNPSLYLYNEHYTPSNATFTSGNFIGVTNISNSIASGTITTTDAVNGSAKVYAGGGFMLYFRGDNITHLAGSPNKTTYPYVAPESVTFSATGNLNQGSYSVVSWTGSAGLLYTTSNAGNAAIRGYNLVGNPYPSSIDWSTFSSSSPSAPIYGNNVNPTIYILNPSTSNYDSYNAVTGIATGSASKIIPSGQGFFVQANAASPTLTFNENAKSNTVVTGSNLLMGSPAAQSAYNSFMKLDLVKDAANSDEIVIGFNSSSTTKYDPNIDAEFLPGLGSSESFAGISSDSVQTTVKWLPFPKNASMQVLRLYVSVRTTGTYTIQRTAFEAIPSIYDVWLLDKYKKDSLDIRNNTSYAFDVALSDSASFGSNRFEVIIRQNPALGVHLLSFAASKVTGGSQIVWTTENEENYTNFTVERSDDGGTNFTVLGGCASSSTGTYSFLDKNPPIAPDMYRLKIVDLNGNISYSNIVTLNYGNLKPLAANNINIYPNPSTSILNLAIDQTNGTGIPGRSAYQNTTNVGAVNAGYDIQIISITGAVVKSAVSTTASWQANVSTLTPGTYVIKVVNNMDKSLVGKSTFIKM
ncbi:beta strand repeat-containing protein [Mucilaginibacter gotjawali]|uniref:beta strand repeat-containing protein n=1 Tax=Mucilaginibacter gotjawali TaxID=1550579 RepID=UPI000BBA64C6|nr:T9SS type A sorting domain-containing protein [Mucilaginibacter gotjawali]